MTAESPGLAGFDSSLNELPRVQRARDVTEAHDYSSVMDQPSMTQSQW